MRYNTNMSKHKDLPGWQKRVLGTLLAWVAAFGVVMALDLLLGEWLKTLPQTVHILILTGVLVTVMGNVVMPTINQLIARIDAKGGRGI